jgi:hypothetical protein
MDVPAGALVSNDGRWWWDETSLEWQPVRGHAPGIGGGDGDRAAARLAAGLPASLDDLTDDQRDQYLAEPTVDAELLVSETVGEVPEMVGDGAQS